MILSIFLALVFSLSIVQADEQTDKIQSMLKTAEKEMSKILVDANVCSQKASALCGKDASEECIKKNIGRLPSFCRDSFMKAKKTSLSDLSGLDECTKVAANKCSVPKVFNDRALSKYQSCLESEMEKSTSCNNVIKKKFGGENGQDAVNNLIILKK